MILSVHLSVPRQGDLGGISQDLLVGEAYLAQRRDQGRPMGRTGAASLGCLSFRNAIHLLHCFKELSIGMGLETPRLC